MTEPENYSKWQPSILELRPHRPGRLRVGSEATEVRRLTSPIQGFGKMWQKTYQVRLPAERVSQPT